MTARFQLDLPPWLVTLLADQPDRPTLDERMALAVDLSRRNVEQGTGGPFGAAVFERDGGRLVAAGVNLVTSARCSLAHAEVVALLFAQQQLDTWDLASHPTPLQLVASTEPCVQCFGAVHWSGVTSLVCGARDEDARAIGFDEGPKRDDWPACLEAEGVQVLRDVGREAARAVLRDYADGGGTIYNARRSDG